MEKKSFETWKPGLEHEKEKINKEIENKKYEEYLLNKKTGGNLEDAKDEDVLERFGGEAIFKTMPHVNGQPLAFEDEYPDYVDAFSQDKEYQNLTMQIKMKQLELDNGEGSFMPANEADAIKKEIADMKQTQQDMITRSNIFRKQKDEENFKQS